MNKSAHALQTSNACRESTKLWSHQNQCSNDNKRDPRQNLRKGGRRSPPLSSPPSLPRVPLTDLLPACLPVAQTSREERRTLRVSSSLGFPVCLWFSSSSSSSSIFFLYSLTSHHRCNQNQNWRKGLDSPVERTNDFLQQKSGKAEDFAFAFFSFNLEPLFLNTPIYVQQESSSSASLALYMYVLWRIERRKFNLKFCLQILS